MTLRRLSTWVCLALAFMTLAITWPSVALRIQIAEVVATVSIVAALVSERWWYATARGVAMWTIACLAWLFVLGMLIPGLLR